MIKKIILMGGSLNLLDTAVYLKKEGLADVIVLSCIRQMDETARGQKMRELLKSAGIRVVETERCDLATIKSIAGEGADAAALSFGAPWIIRSDVINLFEGRVFNAHGTRLPQNRGGGGFSWQILQGNKYGFALIHRLDEGLDTGEIILYREFIFSNSSTPADYTSVYQQKVMEIVKDFLARLIRGEKFNGISQPEYLSSYWPRLNSEKQAWIDWRWSGEEIIRFINAFDEPYCGAHTYLNKVKVYLKSAVLDSNDGIFHPFQSGIIYRVTDSYLAVATTSGSLLINSITDSNKNKDFFKDISPGERFLTPAIELENAMSERIFYTANGLKAKKD